MKNYQPVILLKDTQIPENLGFTARSMLNCGLEKLRVINPKFSLSSVKSYSGLHKNKIYLESYLKPLKELGLQDKY